MGTSTQSRLPRSVRRHIRRQKGLIRKRTGEGAERDRQIAELYGKFGTRPKTT